MMKYGLLLAAVFCLFSLSLSAGINKNVCEPGREQPDPKPKDFPSVPDAFASDIEMYVAVNQTTRSFYELFDAANNRALIAEKIATGPYKNLSLTGRDIYDFNSNQIVEILSLPDGSTYCDAYRLDGKGADTFMFGDDASSTNGFSSLTAFMLNKAYPPVYKGKVTLDMGIKTERWWDCHYIPALDATVTAEWYFTDEDDWTPSSGRNNPMPVMLKVKGRLADIRDIEHTYTFNNFRPTITSSEAEFFKVPPKTVCPHLKGFLAGSSTAPTFPPIAANGYFSFEAELVQQVASTQYKDAGLFTSIKEFYDSSLMLSRFDYTPMGTIVGFSAPGANRPVSEIHDFLTGVAYIKDVELGNCSIVPLAQIKNYDVASVDSTHVRMKTVNEFFNIDGKPGRMNWTFTGQRMVRDIKALTFITERRGFPAGAPDNVTSTIEIAFAAASYLDVTSTSNGIEVMEPLRMWIKVPALGLTMTYNIFNFNEEEPDVWVYDVANCFKDDQKSNVFFEIAGDQSENMENNRKEFTYWLFTSLIGYLGVSPIRVNNLNWVKSDKSENMRVSFQVLDPPTIKGSTNDKLPSSYLLPTSDAIAALDEAINLGDFVVEVSSTANGKLNPVLAIKNSINHRTNSGTVRYVNNTVIEVHNVTQTVTKEVPKPVLKLDAGAAAGIAIAFLVAGAGLGVLIIFLVNKFRAGGSLPNLSMSFSPKTFGDSS